jgi:hypothetical protein
MFAVVLLKVFFFVVDKSERIQKLFIKSGDILAGGFYILNKESFTGAYSDI